MPVARADTTLNSCSPAAFDAAAAAGDAVHFAVDCPNLVVARTVGIGLGRALDIEADGHSVTLNRATSEGSSA